MPYQHALKKKIKTSEFLCVFFNVEDERKKVTFWHIMMYYFKKGKNATETQYKRCVQNMEKVCD